MKKSQYIPVSPWRVLLMATIIALLFMLLLWRVVSLQVLDTDRGYEFLQGQGEARFVRTAVIPAYRGVISDRRGETLAVSTPVISLTANPQVLASSGQTARLARALKMKPAVLERRLERYQGRQFMYLKRHMAPADARAVLQLQFPGVRGEQEYQRYYPAGEIAAHLVGFTNVDDRGIEGLELAYDDWLRGSPGRKQVIKDLYGEVVRDIGELEPARSGKDLSLSIDLRLQYLAHRELQRAIALTGAESGSVVTIDIRTGEVLAMVNHPVYNPNNRKNLKPGQTRNRALVDNFEPGSTMKPLAVLAALESGLFTPQTLIDTSPGRIKVGRKVLLDPVNYGEIDLSKVVAKSSQVGIVKMTLQLDEQAVWQMFKQFGLGQSPGTGFPGEAAGLLPYRAKWLPIERVTLAYGYGLTATPLQLALAYSVLADRGLRHPASLLRLDADEVLTEQVVDPRLARQVLQMLEGATADTGTARRARVAGFRVAGKTGTAHKANHGGYADDRYLALFAGIAPVSNPRLVTVVLINEPQRNRYHGGEVAAPVFSRITAGALRLLNIAPDRRADAGAA
ncbi:MAG: penicillin-binding transpeptidase domain-containing protein [Gammaproteobacteria bacterium]|nr:penicillin-binding transpeptidase domain-containing protein [Gammaproteobacteria bacterium]